MPDIVKHEGASQGLDVFGADFDKAQRIAQVVSNSDLVPPQYRGGDKKAISNCLVAMDVATRTSRGYMEVMQNLNVIHGSPGWKSEYLIQAITSHYGNIRYEEKDEGGEVKIPGGTIQNRSCRVIVERNGKTLTGTKVDYQMAVSQGWWTRSGSKWPSMPEQMLRYRAAAFFHRAYPTPVLMSIRTADEVEDIPQVEDVEAVVVEEIPSVVKKKRAAQPAAQTGAQTAPPPPPPPPAQPADPVPPAPPEETVEDDDDLFD